MGATNEFLARVPRRADGKPPAPVSCPQFGGHLHLAQGPVLDHLRHLRQRQLRPHRDEHMHVIPRQHALNDLDPDLGASMTDDVADSLSHRALQHLVRVFRRPNDLGAVIKSDL